ncbi:MAG: GGDEF domain-containing protein [Xanthobacteraceae bacterium]|nr:GGDEF domain-containing protein [Xanthobacteraceae bacterium]
MRSPASPTAAAFSNRPRCRGARRPKPSRRRCCCSTSTISSRSTTSTATPSATARCRSSPTLPRPISERPARWGGDEFVAVLYNTSREIAATVAERVQVAFEKAAADIDGRLLGAAVSTGMAFSSQGPFDLPAILLQADRALYRAKKDGRNRLAIATPEMMAATGQEPLPNKVVRIGRRSAAA